MSLKYIITGTGRCGTVFFAKLLTSVGISCGHETIFSYDGIERAKARLNGKLRRELSQISKSSTNQGEQKWFPDGIKNIQADSSYMAAPFLDLFPEAAVIHLVREPMEVINSFVDGFGYFKDSCLNNPSEKVYHEFIYKHAPSVLDYVKPLDRAAAYYIAWNEMIERKVRGKYLRFSLNYQRFDRLFNFLEVTPKTYSTKRLNERSHLRKKYTMVSEIPSCELQEKLNKIKARYFQVKI
jgi:hypothetical protein